jgi:hypothetical protein
MKFFGIHYTTLVSEFEVLCFHKITGRNHTIRIIKKKIKEHMILTK